MNELRKALVSPPVKTTLSKREIRQAFFEGMGTVLILGRRLPIRDYTINEALEHDFGVLWGDLLTTLTKLMRQLPADKRRELKEAILNSDIGMNKIDWSHHKPFRHELTEESWKVKPIKKMGESQKELSLKR